VVNDLPHVTWGPSQMVRTLRGWVGITIIIVIRSQMDIVACFLAPWSSGKDPDLYSGIRGNSTADDVITVANGSAFKSLRKHPESSGPWGCQAGSNVTV
jgi:hypothetical protein